MNPLHCASRFSPKWAPRPTNRFGHVWLRATLVFIVMAAAANSALARSPLVSVSVFPSSITNQGEEAIYTFTLSAPAPRKMSVKFVMLGSAWPNNYALVGNFHSGGIVIPAGETSATVTLHTLGGGPGPRIETAVLNLLNGQRYHLGAPDHAQLDIKNLP
jgi:hypothetical protein